MITFDLKHYLDIKLILMLGISSYNQFIFICHCTCSSIVVERKIKRLGFQVINIKLVLQFQFLSTLNLHVMYMIFLYSLLIKKNPWTLKRQSNNFPFYLVLTHNNVVSKRCVGFMSTDHTYLPGWQFCCSFIHIV